jgi:hypothetical protein
VVSPNRTTAFFSAASVGVTETPTMTGLPPPSVE